MNIPFFYIITLTFLSIVQSETELKNPLQEVLGKAVKSKDGFLEPGFFYKNYVLKSTPIIMNRAGNEFRNFSSLHTNPESFTTYLEMLNKEDSSTKNVSFYQFLNNNDDERFFVDTSLPMFIKSQIYLPNSVLCKKITQGLQRTRLRSFSGKWNRDREKDPFHNLLCQIGGQSNLHLIPPSALISKEGASSLKRISEYYTAAMNEGDCLFLPSGWIQQQNSTGKYLSISLSWTLDVDGKESECKEQAPAMDFLTSHFPDDPPVDLMSVIQFHNLHHFIKEYYLNSNLMDLNNFMESVLEDELFDEIPEWDEECKDIATEMFDQLDYNSDGLLTNEDFRTISKGDLQELAGKLDDRLADFADIIDDAKAEKKSSLFNAARKATDNTGDIRKLIEESFSEIFRDMDTSKTKGEPTEVDPENEIKRIEKLLKNSIPKSRKEEL